MVKVFTYPARTLFGNYLRAFFGIVLTSAALLLLNPISVIVYLLVFLLCLFLFYGIRAIIRHLTRLEVGGDGIYMIGPINRRIMWEDLGGFRLNYYSTRRDGEAGWMHLKLKGKGVKLSIDSTIGDFDELVRLSSSVAYHNRLDIDAVTRRNLKALGIAQPGNGSNLVYGTAD